MTEGKPMIDCCGIFGSASGTKFDILLGGIGLASILAWHGLVALSIGILFLGIMTFSVVRRIARQKKAS